MKTLRKLAVSYTLCFMVFVLFSVTLAQAQKKSKYACTEANPESLCTAETTCGSATTPCTVADQERWQWRDGNPQYFRSKRVTRCSA